jgi:hypothetical protein
MPVPPFESSRGRTWRGGHRLPYRVPSGREGCQVEQFPRAVFLTTFTELVRVTGGDPADVA